MPVSRLSKKSRGSATRARPASQAPQAPLSTTMTAREWRALTSRSGSNQVTHSAVAPAPAPAEVPNGSERCNACKKLKITSSRPAAVCALCKIRVCNSCKSTKDIKAIQDHNGEAIPEIALGKNDQEKKILQDYLEESKTTLKNVFRQMLQEMETKKWTYKDGANADVALTKSDEICLECFATVWSDLLYKYRTSIQSSLPESIKKRPNCWYGDECKTQIHNAQHSEKYNHICNKKPGK